jgi:hypothetical protein
LTSWQEWSVNADVAQLAGPEAKEMGNFFSTCER